VADQFPQDKLLDLYRVALDEYRFEVRLGWDRTTYFLVLNSAILTVAATLLKMDSPAPVYAFIALLFLFGCSTSTVGVMAITKAHEYYRRTVVKKTIIEDQLGLYNPLPLRHESLNLAIGTTEGQRERAAILSDPDAWIKRKYRRGSITFWLRWILGGMAVIDVGGFAVATYLFVTKILTTPIVIQV
jgi:hypothetical protein